MKDLTVCHLPIASLPPPLLTYPHEQRRHISSSHPVCGASAKLGRSCSISTPTIRFSHRKKRIRSPKTAGSTPEQPPITAIFDFENESSPKLKRKESSTQNPLRFPQTNPPKRSHPHAQPQKTHHRDRILPRLRPRPPRRLDGQLHPATPHSPLQLHQRQV